jgi:hypothetical protein
MHKLYWSTHWYLIQSIRVSAHQNPAASTIISVCSSSGFVRVMTCKVWTRKRRWGWNRVQYMMDSLFTFAIPSNTIVFSLDFRRFDVQQDKIRPCNWTFAVCPQKDIQSENGVDQNKKYLFEIDHEVRTTDISLRTLSITAPATSRKFHKKS